MLSWELNSVNGTYANSAHRMGLKGSKEVTDRIIGILDSGRKRKQKARRFHCEFALDNIIGHNLWNWANYANGLIGSRFLGSHSRENEIETCSLCMRMISAPGRDNACPTFTKPRKWTMNTARMHRAFNEENIRIPLLTETIHQQAAPNNSKITFLKFFRNLKFNFYVYFYSLYRNKIVCPRFTIL